MMMQGGEDMNWFWKLLLLAAATVAFTGCATHPVTLQYESPASAVRAPAGAPPLTVGTFADARGDDPKWIGAIRGCFGNPLKTLVTAEPVSEIVRTYFRDGLRARGFTLVDSGGNYQIAGTIRKLNSIQIARIEANVEIDLEVLQLPGGQKVFARTYTASRLEGSLITFEAGIFGSVDDLRALVDKTLREVVDKALDDPAFREVLKP
jgi:uncharacterized lipoprotein YajG